MPDAVVELWDAFIASPSALVGAVMFAGFLLLSGLLLDGGRRRARRETQRLAAQALPPPPDPETEAAGIVEVLTAAIRHRPEVPDGSGSVDRAAASLAAERAITLEEQNRQLSKAVAALLRLRADWRVPTDVDHALAALREGRTAPAETIFKSLADGIGRPGQGRLPTASIAAHHYGVLLTLSTPEAAGDAFETAVALDPSRADTWNLLGLARLRTGDPAGAEAAFRTVLACADPDRERGVLGAAVGNLGLVARGRGDLARAEEQFRIALALHAAHGDQPGMARHYANLGQLFQATQRFNQAETYFGTALDIEQGLGRLDLAAGCHAHLAMIADTRGRKEEAQRHWHRARALYERLGMDHMVRVVQNVAQIGEQRTQLRAPS